MREWMRVELHNHTTESDGQLKTEELLDFMLAHRIPAFAMTDHNTVSGHQPMQTLISERRAPVELIRGLEFTTFFGHILCFGMDRYFSWHDLNPDDPDRWFERIRACGATVGIAHPDVCNHTRWQMKLRDWALVDFIEVVNNSHAMEEVNLPAIRRWEALVLAGFRIAATTGLDLHRPRPLKGLMQTRIRHQNGIQSSLLLDKSIRSQQTMITSGPDFLVVRDGDAALATADWSAADFWEPAGPGHRPLAGEVWRRAHGFSKVRIHLRSADGTTIHDWNEPDAPLRLPAAAGPCIARLHATDASGHERLLAISPPLFERQH